MGSQRVRHDRVTKHASDIWIFIQNIPLFKSRKLNYSFEKHRKVKIMETVRRSVISQGLEGERDGAEGVF